MHHSRISRQCVNPKDLLPWADPYIASLVASLSRGAGREQDSSSRTTPEPEEGAERP